jgi:hypothetical protein
MDERQYPPRMTRSQPQLATAYAPGAMFTWEGGKGACMAVPLEGTAIDFSTRQTRRDQMIETLVEFCRNWLARGMAINRPQQVFEVQLLDACFYNPMRKGTAGVDIALDQFEFLRPERMGYLPGPLVYRCDNCEIVREYISPAHQLAEPLPTRCPGKGNGDVGGECRWRQLDVVYVHWSGELEGLSPYRNTLNAAGIVQKIPRCQCGATDFRLFKQGNQFSRWRFKCTGCGAEKEVYQSDKFTLPLLKPLIEQNSGHQWGEVNMIPISYRASPVFYVQTARFIVFDTDPEVVALMMPGREADLAGRIASLHGFGGAEPTPERIKQQLENRGVGPMWTPYEMLLKQAEANRANNPMAAQSYLDAARAMLEGWYATGHVVREAEPSPELAARIAERNTYARKFDPVRSTVEHDALRERKINPAGESANLRLAHADLCAEYDDPDLRRVYEARVAEDLRRAGIADAFLIRKLDMVEYSFGFTRVSPTPETTQHDVRMPVRLKGFPPLANGKRPIYVIEQQNEAIYIRLQTSAVAGFLQSNGVLASLPNPPKTLGGALIESYQDFGLFLKEFSVRDEASRVRQRNIASMTYLLLHTFAHHVMHGIARFSGLDLGSLSEVIFPADLAFLVHRRGMTEDLGNISSMWRDQNAAFLRYLVSRRELRCGSGTLCDHRGGACPACIMVPETSCVAGNQLLSRAALVGGRAPLWDQDQTRLQGYFDLVAAQRAAPASARAS